MSRSPRIEIESGKLNEIVVLSGNKYSDIERRHDWGHDYLANCARQGWISKSRLNVLCADIGVDEKLITKNPMAILENTQLTMGIIEKDLRDEAIAKFCEDVAGALVNLANSLREVS